MSGPTFETDWFFKKNLFIVQICGNLGSALYICTKKTNTSHNKENSQSHPESEWPEPCKKQATVILILLIYEQSYCIYYTWFLSFVYREICGVSIASSWGQFLNSLKRGYAGSGCRSCIQPNKMHLPFINNFIGHIYDFGWPILSFVLRADMKCCNTFSQT